MENKHHSFWISGFQLFIVTIWNQEEFFFSPLLILFFCLQTFAFLLVRTNAYLFVFGPRRSH